MEWSTKSNVQIALQNCFEFEFCDRASEVDFFVSDREVVTQEPVASQSGDRTGVQITAGSLTHLHTATGA